MNEHTIRQATIDYLKEHQVMTLATNGPGDQRAYLSESF